MEEPDWRKVSYRYGPYAVLVGIMAFMLWIRLMPYERVVTSGTVYFSGNDPWYHARMIQLITQHFPASVNFDPWSRFPYGTGRHSGFGGLFDQLIALSILVVSFGDPNPQFIDKVTAIAPPVFGALTAITTYLIGWYLTDKWSALMSAGLLGLMGGQFLTRTIVGVADHQSAEALFGSLAILGFLFAIRTGYAEKPTEADLRDGNWIVLRRPIIASLVGGTAIAAYLMLWGPGIMLVFAMGMFVFIQVLRDRWNDRPIDYIVIVTTMTMVTTGILMLLYMKSFELRATAFSLLQPLVLLGIAAGSVVLYIISEYLSRKEYPDQYYPVAAIGITVTTLIITIVAFPRSLDLFIKLVRRIYSFGLLSTPSSLTVAEIQPANVDDAWRSFSAVFYIAIAGGVIMLIRVVRANRPIELLTLLWSYTIFSAYFSMIRFGYYMAVNVAILAGFGIWWTGHNLLSLDSSITDIGDIQTYQVIGVLIILFAVIPGNVVAVSGQQPTWETAERLGGANQAWHNELQWMQSKTPKQPLEYDAMYDRPADGDFDYPAKAYGVMSWWDYGHWITVQGHRIPFANPFQQGPRPASAYFQTQNETRANLLLEALASTSDDEEDIWKLSNSELQAMIDSQSEQEATEDIRYVMIDDQMAAGKFGAIATWTGPGYSSYISNREVQIGDQTAQLPSLNSQYQNMMLSRLYFQDANGLSHYRLVHETEQQSTIVSVARRTQSGWRTTGFFNRVLRPGIFNQVQRDPNLQFYDVRRESRVKTFEKVPGAKLTGRVDTANATTIIATVRLRTNTGRNFSYVQQVQTDANGRFTMTVPYATTNGIAPENGGTDSGVNAINDYRVFAGNPLRPTAQANVSVPESAIYDGETIQVELTPVNYENESSSNGNTSSIPPLIDESADTGNQAASYTTRYRVFLASAS